MRRTQIVVGFFPVSSQTWFSSHFLFIFCSFSVFWIIFCFSTWPHLQQRAGQWEFAEIQRKRMLVLPWVIPRFWRVLAPALSIKQWNLPVQNVNIWAKVSLWKNLPQKTSIECLACIPLTFVKFRISYVNRKHCVKTALNRLRSSIYKYSRVIEALMSCELITQKMITCGMS